MSDTAKEDREAIAAYRAKRGQGPFIAADAVVVSRDGRVLLIRRKKPPQRDRLAFPGGFVNKDETFLHAALRELAEETGLALSGSEAVPAAQSLRDGPNRDPRARIVSVAFLFRLHWDADAVAVEAADDAGDAAWTTLDGSFSRDDFFADHHAALHALGLLPHAGRG